MLAGVFGHLLSEEFGMRKGTSLVLSLAAIAAVHAAAHAEFLLTPSDWVQAVDGVGKPANSSHPDGEAPRFVIDGSVDTKYLNFGQVGSGFIVTPDTSSILRSLMISTANDADGRDPTSYMLFGTNEPIVSINNGDGFAENWTFLSNGPLSLPTARKVAGPVVNIANEQQFAAYKLIFPTVRNGGENSMQISEVQFYDQADAGGTALLAPSNSILAIDSPVSDSAYPANESPVKAIDGDIGSKYLNFGREGAGLILTPAKGQSVVTGLVVTTAGDATSRDPSAFAIYGTNADLQSPENSYGLDEPWTLIYSGAMELPTDRNTEGPLVSFANTLAFTSYKVLFTDNRGPDDDGQANSMQLAEIQLVGSVVPEPSAAVLSLAAASLGLVKRRRR